MKKAIFLYDYTGLMAQPWLDAGYECWLFDGQHETGIHRDGNLVKVGMWFDASCIDEHAKYIYSVVGDNVSMVFGFPECTHLAVSGAAHRGLLKTPCQFYRLYGESLTLFFIRGSLVDTCQRTIFILSTLIT